MRARSRTSIPDQWLPFVGERVGYVKRLSCLPKDPEDLDLHHAVPTTTSLGALVDHEGEFNPRAGGAGVSLGDAVNRAMGELLERYSGLVYEGANRVTSSYHEMESSDFRIPALEHLRLFSREQLATPGFPFSEFTESTPVEWVQGIDMASGEPTYLPEQLVSLADSPKTKAAAICFYATSSGCALGDSIERAFLSALLEYLERDAVMIRWYARLSPPRLNFDPAELLGRPLSLQARGLEIRFHDMTMDDVAPVVGVSCVEESGRPCRFLLSAAAGLSAAAAARKALIEAGQGRPFIKFLANMEQAPRDGSVFANFDSNVRFFAEPSNARYVDWFFENAKFSARSFAEIPECAELGQSCQLLIDRCSRQGWTPIAFDMTAPELRDHGLSCCRVVVPQLVPLCVPFAPFFGHSRLARHIATVTEETSTTPLPDWLPHPFP